MKESYKILFCLFVALLLFSACKSKQATNDISSLTPVGPAFVADSAFAFCEAQCEFGPRTMNSEAHDRCAQWIVKKFQQYGCQTTLQEATLTGYDGTSLKATNIIASYNPVAPLNPPQGGRSQSDSVSPPLGESEGAGRILLCAHWDSRPWADNDPDSANWHKPVMAANDGASGVAVMLEIARLLQQADSLKLGVDFICFDAEDWGTPQWDTTTQVQGDPWALGAQYWSQQYAAALSNSAQGVARYRFGILLDMVGGQGARFYKERFSKQYASQVVEKVWAAARVVGYGSMFPDSDGEHITDDHVSVNTVAHVPCIDIIPFYPECEQSGFGPTWHTVNDDMQHIDLNTLQGVGQTVIQVLFSEN